ncbi:MAG: hypothetical protein M5R36_15715 [Deltaproteobacteria bacterium]|nr:hypothetical protein [Deltaproteobacteria bacterium]
MDDNGYVHMLSPVNVIYVHNMFGPWATFPLDNNGYGVGQFMSLAILDANTLTALYFADRALWRADFSMGLNGGD